LDAARISDQELRTRVDWTDLADVLEAAVISSAARNADRKKRMLNRNECSKVFASWIGHPFRASRDRDRLLICVRDEGVGLTLEEATRAGERFYRVPRHIGKIPGAGLGLWIASTFVRTSGGSLQLTSEGEGKGTTARITFPIPPKDEAATTRSDSKTA
jgi:nitrogen fixation/metabolism regulation signal transduction histidine kinase